MVTCGGVGVIGVFDVESLRDLVGNMKSVAKT